MLMLVAMLMLVLVGVMVLLLVDAVDGDEHAAAPYAALDGGDELHAHAGYAEGVHARDEIGAIALGRSSRSAAVSISPAQPIWQSR